MFVPGECLGWVFLHFSSLGFGVFPSEGPLFHKKSCSQHFGFIYSESFESTLQCSWSTRSSLIFFTFSCRGRMKQQSNIYFRSRQSQLYQGLSEPFQINSQIFCWIFFPPTWKNTGICSPFHWGTSQAVPACFLWVFSLPGKSGGNEGVQTLPASLPPTLPLLLLLPSHLPTNHTRSSEPPRADKPRPCGGAGGTPGF